MSCSIPCVEARTRNLLTSTELTVFFTSAPQTGFFQGSKQYWLRPKNISRQKEQMTQVVTGMTKGYSQL